MKNFSDINELKNVAKSFLRERTNALYKDVVHCLNPPFAPFPAIVYCFSTIDLLGALSEGNASRSASTAYQAKQYMIKFMRYPQIAADLLMGIFRHKTVHLAQPKAVVYLDGKWISWGYSHNDASKHLKLTPVSGVSPLQPSSKISIPIDHSFEISIIHFARDIADSVHGTAGYLQKLETDSGLQNNFDKAYGEIFDPKK
jgi:hypothetical protein